MCCVFYYCATGRIVCLRRGRTPRNGNCKIICVGAGEGPRVTDHGGDGMQCGGHKDHQDIHIGYFVLSGRQEGEVNGQDQCKPHQYS